MQAPAIMMRATNMPFPAIAAAATTAAITAKLQPGPNAARALLGHAPNLHLRLKLGRDQPFSEARQEQLNSREMFSFMRPGPCELVKNS